MRSSTPESTRGSALACGRPRVLGWTVPRSRLVTAPAFAVTWDVCETWYPSAPREALGQIPGGPPALRQRCPHGEVHSRPRRGRLGSCLGFGRSMDLHGWAGWTQAPLSHGPPPEPALVLPLAGRWASECGLSTATEEGGHVLSEDTALKSCPQPDRRIWGVGT